MAEGSFVGAKIVGILLAITGILLIITGASSLLAFTIPGLPPEVLSALSALSGNAYILIVYGVIALGVSFGLFQAQEWAAGAAAILLLMVFVTTLIGVVNVVLLFGIDYLLNQLLSASISLIIQVGVLVVSLGSLIYLVAASGWR
ncbi:MAG: hypothetical protein ACTSQY_10725 [Candidatus Odinarchaeia archaeon]